MSAVAIAQDVLSKAVVVTMPDRREELYVAFVEAGIKLSPDKQSVLAVAEPADQSFGKLMSLLGKLPVVKIAIKRALGAHNVVV
jgi:hypothetical protein